MCVVVCVWLCVCCVYSSLGRGSTGLGGLDTKCVCVCQCECVLYVSGPIRKVGGGGGGWPA